MGDIVDQRAGSAPSAARLVWGIAGLMTLATPLTAVAAGPGVLPGDVRITDALHASLPGWLDGPLAAANLLGLAPVAMIVTVLLTGWFLVRRWNAEAALVASAALAWGGNATLKLLAESPRPTANLVRVTESADGFGFPSGHVMGLTVLLGAIFIVASRRIALRPLRLLAQAALLLTIALTGLARVEVGAHWPSDVLGGYLWGTAFLLTVLVAQTICPGVTGTLASAVSRRRLPGAPRVSQLS